MGKVAARKPRMRSRATRREPDDVLTRRAGVAYRYVLRLRDPNDAATVLAVLSDAAIPLSYLLLLPSGSEDWHAAYVGLGSAAVADLPVRLASRGIRVERGEERAVGAASMRRRIDRCDVAQTAERPPQGRRTP
jgi:hypothetical protein